MSQANVAASVHQRLLNKSRDRGRPFGELLQYFVMERFLYRLSVSEHSEKFVLKGALMFAAWNAPGTCPTKDIDLLGATDNDVENIVAITRDICTQPVDPDDGLEFDPASVVGESIVEDADYHGVRVRFDGGLGRARIRMQLDVGFGDIVVPGPEPTTYPCILDFPAPELRGYTRETAIAEKLQAAVVFDMLNSRMKDFYDMWLLARQFDFDGVELAKAVKVTFDVRGTEVIAVPSAFSRDFVEAKQDQWSAFVRRTQLADTPQFSDLVQTLESFLAPVLHALTVGEPLLAKWKAPGPWVPES